MAWGPFLIIEVDTIESLRADTALPSSSQMSGVGVIVVVVVRVGVLRNHRKVGSKCLRFTLLLPCHLVTPDPITIASS